MLHFQNEVLIGYTEHRNKNMKKNPKENTDHTCHEQTNLTIRTPLIP
jgi:hypothetical protein